MTLLKKFSLLTALMIVFMPLTLSPAMAATELKVLNNLGAPVDVWWNGTDPGANNINVRASGADKQVKIPSEFNSDSGHGVFSLGAGKTATITRKSGGNRLSGTITFNCLPVCPCGGNGQPPCPQVNGNFNLPKKLVNGVNQGEFTLNPASNFESIDISCVNGANTQMQMRVEGGSPIWTNNVTHQPVTRFDNDRIDVDTRLDKNCTEVGVFPFNADDCIRTINVTCQPYGNFCHHAVPDCQLNRQGGGGSVTIVLNGFTMP